MTQPLSTLGPLAAFARGPREALDVLAPVPTRPAFFPAAIFASTPFATGAIVATRALATIARRSAPRIFVATLVAEATGGRLSRETTLTPLAALKTPTAVRARASVESGTTFRSFTALETPTLCAVHNAARAIVANGSLGGTRRHRLFRRGALCLAAFTVQQHERRRRYFDGVHSLEQGLHDRDP